MILILAGNADEFHKYVIANRLNRRDVVYMSNIDVVRGRVFDSVVVVGTFENRRDDHELKTAARRAVR